MSNVHPIFETLLRPFTPERKLCEDCKGTGIDPGALGPFDRPDCQNCEGTGYEIEYEPGDRIRFRDQDTNEILLATISERHESSGWYEVEVDGITDDLWSISPCLIRGRAPEAPTIERKPAMFETLTLEEQLVASTAVVNYRKGKVS